MLLRQCLQELRLQRGEWDAVIPACHASGGTVAPGAIWTSSTEMPVVTSHGRQDGRQRLSRTFDSARVELALAV
jgi:hypothetical protein